MRYDLDPASARPLFRQLSDRIIRRIRRGELRTGTRLPGTRALARQLGVSRDTVVAAYADVVDQGYLEARSGSGMHVRAWLPDPAAGHPLTDPPPDVSVRTRAAFAFDVAPRTGPAPHGPGILRLTEGSPDVRLADVRRLYAHARRLLEREGGRHLLRYGDGQGDYRLRERLAALLGESRGIATGPGELLVTRGSQHAFALACALLFRGGGTLAVAELSYDPLVEVAVANGASVIRVPLDRDGLDVAALSRHTALADVRAVYVTPHRQYPTTVNLSADRRLALLRLARRCGFAILEDDYDYDFYYERPPRLPLAALDDGGHVLYVGSFTKMLAPNLRVGWLRGPRDFVRAALGLRLRGDRQGDLLLERALAHFIADGELERHLRRVREVYRERRDRAVALLRERLGDRLDFEVPGGGMALWLRWREVPDYAAFAASLRARGIGLSDTPPAWWAGGGMRMGFASLDAAEVARAVEALRAARESAE